MATPWPTRALRNLAASLLGMGGEDIGGRPDGARQEGPGEEAPCDPDGADEYAGEQAGSAQPSATSNRP